MKKSLFWVALAAVSLASCSHDEVVDLKSNEIKFSVVTDNQSRVLTGDDQGIFCANHLMPNFKLYATTDGKTYINGDLYTVNSANDVTSTDTRYWPDTEVDFYATYNEGTNAVALNGNNAPTLKFNVSDKVSEQTDLLYATAANKKRTNEKVAETVALNFRHALSQIVFQARNENEKLRVEVIGVKIGHCYDESTFTFPVGTDTQNTIENHPQDGTEDGANRGTWELSTKLTEMQEYEVTLSTAVKVNSTNTSITKENNVTVKDTEGYNSNAMLVLPTLNAGDTEGTTAWDPTQAATNSKYNGTFIAVKCKIWNVSGGNEDDDILLHGTANDYAYAVIPVSFKWQQGKKYVYTFVFGNGNGGYEDDPENPKPVLVPMTFKVTVDDFQTGTVDPTENEMKTN